MTPPLFRVVAALPAVGEDGLLSGPEGRHAVTVRRIRAGEIIRLGDGAGLVVTAEVLGVEGEDVLRFRVRERATGARPRPTVALAQALPKSDRSELAVELATEAGIDEIHPWQSARCIARWTGPKAVKGLAKWRATAAAAAKQARRPYVPAVHGLVSTRRLVELVQGMTARGGLALILHEAAARPLRSLPVGEVDEILLVVGPEGGVADDEIAALTAAGAVAVVLGPSVLRTSTAAAVALGALGVLTERWDAPGASA